MFGFHLRTMHVFKDNKYNDNNNIIKSIYHVPIIDDLGLKWMMNVFMIIAKNLSKSPQSVVFMPEIVAFIVKALPML